MRSRSLKKLVRRFQFAQLVAGHPKGTKAAYNLIRRPHSADLVTLGGLADSLFVERLLQSPLMWTGNIQVPLQVSRHLYVKGRRDEALSLVRRTPGSAARMLEAEFRLYSGEIDKAKSIFSAAADRAATKATALRNVALCHYLERDVDAAIRTIIIAAATYPRNMSLMTLFSRIVRDGSDISHYLDEKIRLAKHGLTLSSSAQLIRACGRAAIGKSKPETIASDAIINLCSSRRRTAKLEQPRRTAAGIPTGQFSTEKGNIILDHISSVTNNTGIRLFLMGGTLLGLIRDQQLLAWDKDIDFGCFAEDATIHDVWRVFSESPYFVPMGVVADRLIKLRHISGVTVDVFINFLDEGVRWHGGQFVFWRDKNFSLKQIDVGGREFYIPEDPSAYLVNHYGEAWDLPDPHFDVFWEAPDAFDANTDHRYVNTLAKGLQFLSARSPDVIVVRRDRARWGGADDVAAAYDYVLRLYDEFTVV